MNYLLGLGDLRSIGKGLLIAEAGAVLATASLWLQSGKFDFHQLLILEGSAVLSVLVNTLLKVVDGQKN